MRRAVALFPLTPLGMLVVGVALAALKWLAYAQLDLSLLVVGYAAVGLVALSALMVTASAAWVAWRLRRRPGAALLLADTRHAVDSGFSVPGLRFVPFVQLRWLWQVPDDVAVSLEPRHGWLRERVEVWERGQHRRIVRRFWVQDPFGLSRVGWLQAQDAELDVLPSRGALRQMPVLTALSHGDELPHPLGIAEGDRMELRRYVPGDPARFIHWKAFARTRRLVVRHPERALTPARRTAAFLVAGPDDDATAAAARVALEEGLLGSDWLFGTDAEPRGTARLPDALAALMRSRSGAARAGTALGGFLERAAKDGPVSTLLFLPAHPGLWLDRVIAALARHRGPVRAVIGVDGLAEETVRPVWQRWLVRPVEPDAHDAARLREVLRRLRAARCEVLVLDRPSGRALSEGHLRPRAAAVHPRQGRAA